MRVRTHALEICTIEEYHITSINTVHDNNIILCIVSPTITFSRLLLVYNLYYIVKRKEGRKKRVILLHNCTVVGLTKVYE